MAKRFHINPETGKPGLCNPVKTGVCKYGSDVPHFSSEADAYAHFEQEMGDSFTVLVKTDTSAKANEVRTVKSLDADIDVLVHRLEQDYAQSEKQVSWINAKVERLDEARMSVLNTYPGSPERFAALDERTEARRELLAADLVVWRNSDFYDEDVEQRMKVNAVTVADADQSIEQALADKSGLEQVASAHSLSVKDVESILEVAHEDYLRPRGGLSKNLKELSSNDMYTETTAFVFRVEPKAVQGVLDYASKYSKMEKAG